VTRMSRTANTPSLTSFAKASRIMGSSRLQLKPPTPPVIRH